MALCLPGVPIVPNCGYALIWVVPIWEPAMVWGVGTKDGHSQVVQDGDDVPRAEQEEDEDGVATSSTILD